MYSNSGEKPLLGERSPEGDENWSGWGDEWGNGSDKSPSSPSSEGQAGNNDGWEDWSNEQSPVSKDPLPPTDKDGDDWNNEEWGSGLTSSDTTTTTSASVNKKKKAQPKKAKPSQKEPYEPAMGNLIDLGGDPSANSSSVSAGDGWDNDSWAQEDDEWQSLELDSAISKSSSKTKSNKGD